MLGSVFLLVVDEMYQQPFREEILSFLTNEDEVLILLDTEDSDRLTVNTENIQNKDDELVELIRYDD